MKKNKLISIVIPVYEMNGVGVKFLEHSLSKIKDQTYKNVELIISDHSLDFDIYNLCESEKESLEIKYLRNENNRGNSSSNLNYGLHFCTGEIIKILMQDEFLWDNTALEKIESRFCDESVNWLVSGCVAGEFPENVKMNMVPRYDESLVKTVNTIGSPSVLTIRNKNIELFDESFIWVMDCDYYIRCFQKYGYPEVISEPLVFICWHDSQLTNKIDIERKKNEEKLLLDKYMKI
jgi:glycosyltransferase involved in cell wall biosynthesis